MNRRIMLTGIGAAGMIAPSLAIAAAKTASKQALAEYRQGTLTISTISRKATETALQRATDPKVKAFAALEMAEQITVGQVLTNRQQPPFVTLGAADTDALQHLASLPAGQAFDQAYVAAEIGGHQKLLGIQQTLLAAEPLGSDVSHIATFLQTFIHEHLELLAQLQKAG